MLVWLKSIATTTSAVLLGAAVAASIIRLLEPLTT
jgi:hypothetical protein